MTIVRTLTLLTTTWLALATSSVVAQDIAFTLGQDLMVPGQAADVQIADLDNDGLRDVIVLLGSGTAGCCPQGPLLIYPQSPVGNYLPPVAITVAPVVPNEVRIEDFDQDGNLDMVVTGVFTPTVEILYGDGALNFTSVEIDTDVFLFQGLDTGNLDGDAFPDILLGELGANAAKMLLNDGSGFFTASSIPLPGDGQWSVRAFDGNGDGITDIMIGLDSLSPLEGYFLPGTGGGLFGPTITFTTEHELWELSDGDIDNDGDLDVVGAALGDTVHTVLINDGAGNFTLGTPIDAGVAAADVELVDLNLDGNLDVVLPRENETGTDIYQGDGAGGFTLVATIPGMAAYKVAAADLDLDDVPDLAIASVYNSWAETHLNTTAVIPTATFRRGDSNQDFAVDIGDVIFTLGLLFTTPGALLCEDAADANDDGQIDIGDAVASLNVLFVDPTNPFPEPGSSNCGEDPTDDTLTCEEGCP